MASIERALKSIGKKAFVIFYYDFKNCLDNEILAKALLDQIEDAYSKQAQLKRISSARWIFDNRLEHEAFKIIISSKRIDNDIKSTAQDILDRIS